MELYDRQNPLQQRNISATARDLPLLQASIRLLKQTSSNGLEKRPKLRFPGFDKPWKVFKAEELFQNITDKNHPDETVLTIIQGKGTLPREQAGRNIHYDDASLSNYKKVEQGDFIIHLRSFEGGLEMANEAGIVSPAYTILRCKRPHSSLFYDAYFHTDEFINHNLSKSVEGIRDGRQISYEAFKWLGIPYCEPTEQEKISNLFAALNERIAKQRDLIEALKKYKRGAVAHILSGKSVAFAVTSSWTEHTLSELCSEFRSGRNISATLIHQTGNFPVYGGNGIRGYCNQYSHDGEYVVVGRQGALCGNVRLIQGKNYLSEHAIAVQANEANETKFLLYLLDYMKLGQYSDQGAQPGLAVNKLLRLKCMVPDKQTQIKIASFLMSFDFQISTQERMLMLLNCQRRALLQQLFI